MLKRIIKAFLAGGIFGIIGQLLINLVGHIITDQSTAMMIGIFIFGLIGVILILSGLYFKISNFADKGADIPVCGLMFGASNGTADALRSGQTIFKSFLAGFTGVIKVLGIGYIIAFVMGIIFNM